MLLEPCLGCHGSPLEGSDFSLRGNAAGIELALPFLVVGTLLYAGLGFINRAMPQLMVFFVAAPAITATGLILFLIALPMILTQWAGGFDTLLAKF